MSCVYLRIALLSCLLAVLCGCGGARTRVDLNVPYCDPRALIQTARSQLGAPYRLGGASPDTGFDCSGFACWVFAEHGIVLPRQSSDQLSVGERVSKRKLRPGDLVFFKTGWKGASHVGIFAGDGRFIHSPNAGGCVREERLSESFWRESLIGCRRILR